MGPTHQQQHYAHSLVQYDSEPKAYPRHRRHSKEVSPSSSTDNEAWVSACDDVAAFRVVTKADVLDSHGIPSRSPPSPPLPPPPTEDSRPIFFASSRRGSRGSTEARHESSGFQEYHQQATSSSSRRSSRSESEAGSCRRDSKSGYESSSGGGRRDSRTTPESSATSRRDSRSASLEEVLDSLLAIPSSSRSSSPTSPRRSSPSWQRTISPRPPPATSGSPPLQVSDANEAYKEDEDQRRRQEDEEDTEESPNGRPEEETIAAATNYHQQEDEDHLEDQEDRHHQQQGKDSEPDALPAALPYLPPTPTTSSTQLLPQTPEERSGVNNGSFCHSTDDSGQSPVEGDIQSPKSVEVLAAEEVPKEDDGLAKETENEDLGGCPPAPQCSRLGGILSTCLQEDESDLCVNPFIGLPPGSYCRGIAEGNTLPRRHSLCLVLLHLPCMVCARPLAPPSLDSFHSSGVAVSSRMLCLSEPSTPLKEGASNNRDGASGGDGGAVPRITHQPATSCDPYMTDMSIVGPDSGRGRGGSTSDGVGTERGSTDPDAKDGADSGRTTSPLTTTTATTKTSRKKSHHHQLPSLSSVSGGGSSSHLKCHRPKCTKSLPVEEARAKFRTCANCYTYYCSRQCRKMNWTRHKEQCPHTRISNLCKQVLMKARDDPVSRRHLSLCARRGLLSRGRGAVKLMFLNPEDALDYLVHGWDSTRGQTLYVSRSDLLPQEMGSDVFSQVRSFCDKYNPDRKFILLAAITVTNEVAAAPVSCPERDVVVRGAKMHLSPSLPEDDVQTLILTITNNDPQTGDPPDSTEEDRRQGLDAVDEQLAARGVHLSRLFPDIYLKILRFVEKNEPFVPISIFPTDKRSGRVFMCIILPWADADIIVNISSKSSITKSSRRRWIL